MKILILNNQSVKDKEISTFVKGVEHLRKLGHNIKKDSDLVKNVNAVDGLKKLQSKLEKSIREADIIITEVTNPDAKVGFDIAKALSEKKIVVALQKENNKNQFAAIHGNKQRSLLLKVYNEKNVEEVIEKAVEEAKGKLDTKFILIISPEIDRYLDWSSQTKRMHKAQIVRNAVEKEMGKDKEYKTFLKG